MTSFELGILQGRLSPSHDGRFQFFPKDWKAEFYAAKELGIDSIEWLFDWPEAGENPIITESGREEIKKVVQETGVQVSSVCADYYMKHRFTGEEAGESVAMLERLIDAATVTREKLILIPLLEGNAPKTEVEKNEIIFNITKALPRAEQKGVRIAFENEMPAGELLPFLEKFKSKHVGVYYDIGNGTSYGFDCPAEIKHLGSYVFGVHAKDRKVHTTQSVTLGTGDANYQACFAALAEQGFSGTVVMQAWRSQDYLEDAKQQYSFLKGLNIQQI